MRYFYHIFLSTINFHVPTVTAHWQIRDISIGINTHNGMHQKCWQTNIRREGAHYFSIWLRKYLQLHGIEWSTALLSSAEAREAPGNTPPYIIYAAAVHIILKRARLWNWIYIMDFIISLPPTGLQSLSFSLARAPLQKEPGASAADRKCTWKESSNTFSQRGRRRRACSEQKTKSAGWVTGAIPSGESTSETKIYWIRVPLPLSFS